MPLLQLKWLCLELQLCLAVIGKYTHGDLVQLWFRLGVAVFCHFSVSNGIAPEAKDRSLGQEQFSSEQAHCFTR